MAAPLIGILGAYGAVGTAAARRLAAAGRFRLRLGGRDAERAQRLADRLGPAARAHAVDARDRRSLAAFTADCRAVLNCAGPAYHLLDRVRQAAFAAGADYVDVMDDGAVTAPAGDRTAVLSAGLVPGLSGLLPGLLAERVSRPLRFTGGYAGLGTLTRTGAADYLLSLERGFGVPMGIWRGRVVTGALRTDDGLRVPGLPRPVRAVPFLTSEVTERARALGLEEARWYNAFDGDFLYEALNRVRLGDDRDLDVQVTELVRASTLDAAGRTPYHALWGSLDGIGDDGVPVRRGVLVRGADGSALTGEVGAFAVTEMCDGRVPVGTHRAAGVLSPRRIVERLRSIAPGLTVTEREEPAASGARHPGRAEEEGVL
ncbi:saccharopine dehydrogenase-like protein [Streptomyces sp. BK208]|uniref:saccharopine dehydrogenase NADP-binding domain-containing protein n=1 Tax=Streptomyces sp. BK208 TaxID=2512150 RepID=UPI0010619663|nr:saccharopine dehydrogenase NADP-binding domain-containing protein [Streptomyces sp. BK208]TDT42714.1 saccharopine dehydrogenase-like protein [Streptomyces sp. BK208]